MKAIDGSAGLAKIALAKLGLIIEVMRFHEMVFENEFDGVWASCSLLHLNPEALEDAYHRVFKALKSGGYFYASFKFGEGAGFDSEGRFFNYVDEQTLQDLACRTGFKTSQIMRKKAISPENTDIFIHWMGFKQT